MSQYRQNPITKQWVLIAPNRSKRPEEYSTYPVMGGALPVDHRCVFCPGHEQKHVGLSFVPSKTDWEVAVIANKYPALQSERVYHQEEFYAARSGYGEHEVIITRLHNEPPALQSHSLISRTLQTFIDRIQVLAADRQIHYVQLFHNHGRDAGASMIHPHYQLMATHFIPPHLHAELSGCSHYFNLYHTCLYCAIIGEEQRAQQRIILETEHFIVMAPYASRSPFETWILPKQHQARFEDLSLSMRDELAAAMKFTLGKLYVKLSDPPLNFYIHTMPFIRDAQGMFDEQVYHWHMTIFPRLTIWAGFEYGTGIPVNPMPPEETTEFLTQGL
jgi:UDPglucose--hexose-1-phosphate uridylyltransferase